MNAGARQRRRLTLAILLLSASAPSAQAAGMNLFWNDCSPNGVMNRSPACDSNSGSYNLVASFDPPNGIAQLVGLSAVIDIQADTPPLPSWWQLAASACREGSMQLELDAPTPASCIDYWLGSATGSFSFLPDFGGFPGRARIVVSVGIPGALAGPVEAGTEYYAFRLVLDNVKTIGPEACGGCLAPTCIALTALWLYQAPGLGDHGICNPLTTNLASWQRSLYCPSVDSPPPWWPQDCLATPTRRRTWGLIKGLYR